MKLDWDTPLPSELLHEWQSLVSRLAELDEISFDRYFGIKDRTDLKSIELHGFSDASDRAYGACAYLCFRYSDGTCKNSLVTAKSRLKPTKKVSVPRLELLGILIVSRLIVELDKILDLDISMIKLWTDSSAAFGWIKSDSVDSINEVFVKNRVRDIKKLLNDSIELRLVPSKQNPSDYVTKEGKSKNVIDNLWLHGPHFLTKPESEWPVLKCGDKFSDDTGCNVIETEIQVSTVDFTDLVDTTKFSDVTRLLRVIALVGKYTSKLLQRAREKIKKKNEKLNEKLNKRPQAEEDDQQKMIEEYEQQQPLINADDLSQAKTRLILSIQRGITKERIRELDLFYDEIGVLRLRGRLENAPLPYDTRHPIWLPPGHDVTELYIADAHRKVLHNGARETVAEMKTRFYVPRLRQKVRSFIHKCTVCRRMEGPSYLYPEKSNLPKFRFAETPFSTIGIDYAGPYLVRNVYDENDKSTHKCWISLITCLSCRAIHLDIAKNYDSQACCDVLKRFIARYGVPKLVVSDNGTSFIGPEVRNFATNNDIVWKFNLQKAPWQGGVFERLIKSVKRCLSKVMLKKTFTYDELLTTLNQIEVVINNRPLCYTDENDTPLTPNHLVFERRIGQNEREIDSENYDESLEKVNKTLDHFWKMWSRDYLTEIRDIRRKSKSNGKTEIKIGDVVLIHDDKLKRSKWRIGRVDELIISRDGQVRGAGLITITEKGTGRLKRPVNKLFPFETDSNEEVVEPEIKFIKDDVNIISHP
ncbi:uncharacterized protein [Clytia hemisphaerica]|uniref:uncharacterized protein n=1 Tax=Clytia hemisphaerica TaxID=252671 RepID=UPI0034D70408